MPINVVPDRELHVVADPQQVKDHEREQQILGFLDWMLVRGETMAAEMNFAPLPRNLAVQVRRKLRQVQQTAGNGGPQ